MRDNDKISCSAKEIKTNLSIGKYAFDKSMHEINIFKINKKKKGKAEVQYILELYLH